MNIHSILNSRANLNENDSPKAWQQGRKARSNGFTLKDSPYNLPEGGETEEERLIREPLRDSWMKGYLYHSLCEDLLGLKAGLPFEIPATRDRFCHYDIVSFPGTLSDTGDLRRVRTRMFDNSTRCINLDYCNVKHAHKHFKPHNAYKVDRIYMELACEWEEPKANAWMDPHPRTVHSAYRARTVMEAKRYFAENVDVKFIFQDQPTFIMRPHCRTLGRDPEKAREKVRTMDWLDYDNVYRAMEPCVLREEYIGTYTTSMYLDIEWHDKSKLDYWKRLVSQVDDFTMMICILGKKL